MPGYIWAEVISRPGCGELYENALLAQDEDNFRPYDTKREEKKLKEDRSAVKFAEDFQGLDVDGGLGMIGEVLQQNLCDGIACLAVERKQH